MPNDAPMQPPVPYLVTGEESQGLICGYQFITGQAPRTLDTLATVEAAEAAGTDGFCWLHFNLNHVAGLRWLQEHGGLSEAFFEALHEGSRSTRIERDGDTLFAVVNDVAYDFNFDASDVATLWVSVSPGRVITARWHPLRSVDHLRMVVKRGEEQLASSVDLLDQLLRFQADELQRIARRVADRLEDIEDELLAGHHQRHTAELARLRRLAVRLQRLLAPEPSALMRTLASPPGWVQAEDRAQLHRASEEFALVLRDIAALQERIKAMQDEVGARVAEENNRTLFMLTMVTVLALPINLISGLFGMNVGGIPLSESKEGFWLMLGFIVLLTAVIAWMALRRLVPRGDAERR